MEYPEFCKDCWKLEGCKQKQYMFANTEPVEGYADFDAADYYCSNCLNPQHESAWCDMDESDYPKHCANCGRPLNTQLTIDGVEYLKQAISEGAGCCRELWPELYKEYLED